jgi:hypothetical protein
MPTPGATRTTSPAPPLGQQVRPATAFGEELRRRRRQRQWSQRELGEAIHFSREYVALIERGARPPTPAFAQRVGVGRPRTEHRRGTHWTRWRLSERGQTNSESGHAGYSEHARPAGFAARRSESVDSEGRLIGMSGESMQADAGSFGGDRLVLIDLAGLGRPQIVVVDGLPRLRVDDGVRLLELRVDGSEVSERAALRFAGACLQLVEVSRLERRRCGAGAGVLGRLPAGGHGFPGAAVVEPGGVGWVTGCGVRPLRAAVPGRPAP